VWEPKSKITARCSEKPKQEIGGLFHVAPLFRSPKECEIKSIKFRVTGHPFLAAASDTNFLMTLLSILALGFFLGMRHATDSEHVIAVTIIVSRNDKSAAH
jgi:high-affinity nickel permease